MQFALLNLATISLISAESSQKSTVVRPNTSSPWLRRPNTRQSMPRMNGDVTKVFNKAKNCWKRNGKEIYWKEKLETCENAVWIGMIMNSSYRFCDVLVINNLEIHLSKQTNQIVPIDGGSISLFLRLLLKVDDIDEEQKAAFRWFHIVGANFLTSIKFIGHFHRDVSFWRNLFCVVFQFETTADIDRLTMVIVGSTNGCNGSNFIWKSWGESKRWNDNWLWNSDSSYG